MKHARIVSSRVVIKAHHAQIYRFLDNFDNHQQILPGVGDWSADKDSARYSQQMGVGRQHAESKIVERHVGLRICEESNGASALKFKRYYKIQQDDQTSVCEISIVFHEGLTLGQKLLVAPFVKAGLDQSLMKLKAIMEKPKPPKAPAVAPVAAAVVADAPAAPVAATPVVAAPAAAAPATPAPSTAPVASPPAAASAGE